jgi:hypothetical protein
VGSAVGTTDASTDSTHFKLIPDMTVTGTTSGGDCLVMFTTSVDLEDTDKLAEFALFVDSTEKFRIRLNTENNKEEHPINLTYLVTNLSAASHTFEIKWKTVEYGREIYQYASTWGAGRSLVVLELDN